MNERNLIVAGGVLGALAGAALSYVFCTEGGRRWRAGAEENFSTFIQEAERLLSAAAQVRQSVADLRAGSQTGWPRSA